MKKLIAIMALAGFATTAIAQHHGHGHGGGWGYRGSWVGPAIIGGVIGYELSRPRYDPYYQYPPQQVIIQQQPQIVYVQPTQVCEVKTEVINGQVVTGNFCYQK
jgi:hypothetical protein